MTTILLCATDPADRAMARTTFSDRAWYVIESAPEDLRKVVATVLVDVVVVIGNPDAHGHAVKSLTADARMSSRQIVHVRYPTDALNAASQVSGITRKR